MYNFSSLANSFGLILDIIAGLLLWKFGLPENINREGHINLVLEQTNESEKRKAKKYDNYSKLAVIMLIIGFILQLVSNIQNKLLFSIFNQFNNLKIHVTVNWIELLIGAIIGFISALISAYLFEMLKKPNVKIYPNPIKQFGVDRKWLFLNVYIENKKQHFPFRSANVNHASAWIYFYNFDNGKEIKFIRARWSTTKQPIILGGQPDYSSLLVPSRETIPIEEKSEIPVILKIDDKNDHNIYAFNNESYEFNNTQDLWRKKEHSIGKESKYRIKIKVLADGHEFIEKFILLNPKQNNSIDTISLQLEDSYKET